MPATVVVDHPLAAERLAVLRDERTPPPAFRAALGELSTMLVYEACRSLPTRAVTVRTPLADAPGRQVDGRPVLVPVLRAGLGMLDAALRLLPNAEVAFLGLRRDEHSLRPETYLVALPPGGLAGRHVLVLDPMLATGGSLLRAFELLANAGASKLSACCVLAAPEGLAALDHHGFDGADVTTAAIDERLNEIGFIVPGLGDAGDRQFGPL